MKPLFQTAHLLKNYIRALSFFLWCAAGHAYEWPQEVDYRDGEITIYQPQPEAIERDAIIARSALSIQFHDADEPVFGVAWFTARVTTDRALDQATFTDIHIDRASWPDAQDLQEQSLSQAIERAFSDTAMHMKLSDLTASLAANQKAHDSLNEIDNTPPRVIFREELAVLLLFDGQPRFSAVEKTRYERALNTAMVVVKDTQNQRLYLTNGSAWYKSIDPLGPWTVTDNPPRDLVQMIEDADQEETNSVADAPTIVTAIEPTELIVSTGPPSWTSLDGGQLLYVQNTETPWIRDLNTGNVYVQLSGRWYRATSEKGPWVFVRGDKLPDSFARIPPASDIGGVRSSVAGTPEAEEAVADAQIPQTAAIDRSEAFLTVNYDGRPDFKAIKGTSVAYALNTDAQVLRINDTYYAVDNGVWFFAKDARGPWQVADSVPDEDIASIPPSAPVYNTTHVHIYQSTPSVVYVGYTPGYLWSFNYYGVPVYGTGWYYPPYIGRVYYPRTPTWGFHVGYNPWLGWNYGVSWGAPFYRAGVMWHGGWGRGYHPGRCCGGFYGGGYRHNDITINTGDIHIGRTTSIGRHTLAQAEKTKPYQKTNLYRNDANKRRIVDQASIHKDLKQTRQSVNKKNNLYADPNGRVARHDGNQWHLRDNNKWRPVDGNKPIKPDNGRAPLPDKLVNPQSRPAALPNGNHHTRPAVHPETGHHVRPAVKPGNGHHTMPPVKPTARPAPKPQPKAFPQSQGGGHQAATFNHAHMDRHMQARQRMSSGKMATFKR
ncbi:hypothetical protein GCM10007052_29930 [Halioglobus japonicus]|uniref:Carbohydrate-binding family V/XII n=1 Tax=Halioglobus japonicus TaxID=930805 RepID=A0AAP8MHL1_9GAMM|nr:proline-rich domain-containing protein [Halioglobus japonicus]PLW88000.1 carbohydrate-binding family V/XII [Halioglobus japonicus]GHD20408.1 hypothetical protein GCM10007052_29930 [Halioglobus japonicus]